MTAVAETGMATPTKCPGLPARRLAQGRKNRRAPMAGMPGLLNEGYGVSFY